MNNTTEFPIQPTSPLFLLGAIVLTLSLVGFAWSRGWIGNGTKGVLMPISFLLLAALGIGMFALQNVRENDTSAAMAASIEKSAKVTELRMVEGPIPPCVDDFQGSLQAATWKTGERSNVGVLVGKKEGNSCIFSLKNVR